MPSHHPTTGVRSFFGARIIHPWIDSLRLRALRGHRTGGNPPIAAKLYHLVGTYDGETVRFYINGKLNNILGVRGHIEGYAPTDGMGIVGEFKNVNPVFYGRISEVAVYDRTLRPERIEAHYRAGLRPTAKKRL